MKQKAGKYVFVILVIFAYGVVVSQLRENFKLHTRRIARVDSAMTGPEGHPLLIYSHTFVGFVKAYNYIEESNESRFWIVSDYLDPSILLNYYIYPKEARMRAAEQDALNLKYLNRNENPIDHPPFSPGEPVLYVDLDDMKVLATWDGSL